MKEIHLTKQDFRVDWFSGTGGGGQHRNKHANCCRITHIESGLKATGQSHRERPANQKEAFEKLARLVISWYSADEATRARFGATERIRTYHEPRNQVIDHASCETQEYKATVGKPDLGPMIRARRSALGGTSSS